MIGKLNNFQMNTLKIMSKLLEFDAVDDFVIDELWKNELEYFSLLDKYKILCEKVNIDEKTGLLKYNENYLTDIVKTASRIMNNKTIPELNIGFVRFDIDDFSRFNNSYGHDLGDEILKTVSSIIRDCSRPTDYVIRFGGEEFDVILPSTDQKGAEVYANKILEETRKASIRYSSRKKLSATMSAGISSCCLNLESAVRKDEVKREYRTLQKRADDALYEAKFLGKNRFSIYSPARQNEYMKIRNQYNKNR